MGMTITEKIIAAHADKATVAPGDIIMASVDVALGNDITAPIAIKEFRKICAGKVFDPRKIVLVADHFTPNKDIQSAEQSKMLREFAREQGLTHFYDVGRCGVEHSLLPERGIVIPGDLVIGADSHTCTYGALGAFGTGVGSTDLAAAMAIGKVWLKVPESIKFVYRGEMRKWVCGKDLILYTIGQIGVDGALYKAMEFTGDTISRLPMPDRISMCNMAIEAGGKSGIIAPDRIALDYSAGRSDRTPHVYASDGDAHYEKVIEFDVSSIEPQVAFPSLPENARGISKVGEVRIDQVVIGSCTNGQIEDLRIAAGIFKGKKVHPDVRTIVIPATQGVYAQALVEGLLEIFVKAEAAVSTPTCGPCLGGHMGVLAEGERALATTNRNFVGRMGHPKSEVYLCGPAVAAASAVAGRICSPDKMDNGL
ncbi:MAG: 3-isopropylmalate dehydratase large subunit [Candidatus Aureabacteria bacterium]|nr:3-isopropylmalate dehydratase large subunit [Candidatus Auribacterota bacterium]